MLIASIMDHAHMTSSLEGGEGVTPKADKSTDKLHECDSDKGGGVHNPRTFQKSYE